jgi:hypothetical protein
MGGHVVYIPLGAISGLCPVIPLQLFEQIQDLLDLGCRELGGLLSGNRLDTFCLFAICMETHV